MAQVYMWPKFGTKILHLPGFSDHHLLWPWPLTFWSQNLISTSMNPNTPVTKIGWNFFHWFLRYGVHNVFDMLDGIQTASGTVLALAEAQKHTFSIVRRTWCRLTNWKNISTVKKYCCCCIVVVVAAAAAVVVVVVDLHRLTVLIWLICIHIHYRASYANTVLAVIVCLSVRLSVTSQSCTKTAKPRITLTTPYDSAGTLDFRCQTSRRNSDDITPRHIEVG